MALSPKNLQSIGENLTHKQAGSFLLRLVFLWPAFIIIWASSAAIFGVVIEAIAGEGSIFLKDSVNIFSLYTLLIYALGFGVARLWYKSSFVREKPIIGSLFGFLSIIAAGWIMKALSPALDAFF